MSRKPALTKKHKSRNTREADWEPLKARIIELHISQGLPLQEVRETLKDEAGFDATVRQYRSRISKWNLDKNVKSSEMKFIAQKQEQRKITEPHKGPFRFRVRGLPVDPAKIERWKARTGFDISGPLSPSTIPDTPCGLSYTTDSDEESPESSPVEPERKFSFVTESLSPKLPYRTSESKIDWKLSLFDVSNDENQFVEHLRGSLQMVTSDSELQEELLFSSNLTGMIGHGDPNAQSEESLRQALLDQEGRYGVDHPSTFETQERLACLMLKERQWKHAEDVIVKLLSASRQWYGDQHENTIWVVRLLGDAILGQRQWMKAEKIHQDAYDLMKSTLGPEAPRTLGCLAALANNFSRQSRHREASVLSLRLFESTFKMFGQNHPLTVIRAAKLAESYFHMGQYDRAEALFVHVLSAHTFRSFQRITPNIIAETAHVS